MGSGPSPLAICISFRTSRGGAIHRLEREAFLLLHASFRGFASNVFMESVSVIIRAVALG